MDMVWNVVLEFFLLSTPTDLYPSNQQLACLSKTDINLTFNKVNSASFLQFFFITDMLFLNPQECNNTMKSLKFILHYIISV